MQTRRDAGDDSDGERVFDVEELRHNIDKLIEISESQILESSKKLDYEKNLETSLIEEEKALKESLEKDDDQVQRLNIVLDLIDR